MSDYFSITDFTNSLDADSYSQIKRKMENMLPLMEQKIDLCKQLLMNGKTQDLLVQLNELERQIAELQRL